MTGTNPLKASDYQDPDDTARQAAEAADASIAASTNDSFNRLQDDLDIALIAAALAAGGWLAVRRLITIEMVTEAFRPTAAALVNLQNEVGAEVMAGEVTTSGSVARPPVLNAAGLVATAQDTVTDIVTTLPRSVIPLTYDPIATATVAGQQQVQTAWLQRITTTIEAVIDQDIRQGLTNGMTAEDIARVIKATIGLTPRQAAAVENFRRLLENGDAAALDRVLRDRRFDASVQRLIDGGTIDQAKIDRMVQRYAERYQLHRAMVIAKTESLRATNAGRRAAWAQYADRTGSDVLRWWLTAADERVCPVCSAIPLMNADGVPMGQPYATPDGPMMMPPEPHANCRCTERFSVNPDAMQRAA